MLDLFLDEAYFGTSNKNLKEVENNFAKIIEVYKKNNLAKIKYTPVLDAKSNKEINVYFKNIENLLKKEFNFQEVIISKASGSPSINACVFLTGIDKMISGLKTTKDAKGVKFSKPTITMYMIIYDNFFFGDYTPEEITAVLLHEVGHKFFPVNNYSYVGYTLINFLLSPYGLLQQGVVILAELIGHIHKMLRTNPVYNSIDTVINNVQSTYVRMAKVFAPLEFVGHNLTLVTNFNPFNFIFATRNEKFADNFATSYGYGPALSSALMKFEKGDGQVSQNIPVLRTIYDCTFTWLGFIGGLIDCHPNTYQRADDNLKYLKSEASKIKDERMKKEIDSQIKLLEDTINDFRKTYPQQQLIQKQKPISAALATLQYTILKGKAPQSLITRPTKGDWEQFK